MAGLAQHILTHPENVEAWDGGSVPPEYWRVLLEFIYHGHEALAWHFADIAWPEARPGKDAFLAEFRARLSKSPYWPDIRAVSLGD